MPDHLEMLMMDMMFKMSNNKYALNGYIYGNSVGYNMKVNETVRWYVMSLGSETDLHGVHWHGATLLYQGMRVDTVDLIPGSVRTVDMVPDVVGSWLFHCHTNHHIHGGMSGLFHVAPCGEGNQCLAEALTQSSDRGAVGSQWGLYFVASICTVFVCAALLLGWYYRKKFNARYKKFSEDQEIELTHA